MPGWWGFSFFYCYISSTRFGDYKEAMLKIDGVDEVIEDYREVISLLK